MHALSPGTIRSTCRWKACSACTAQGPGLSSDGPCCPALLHTLPQIVPNFRVRTIPVLGTTPAVFGMAAAGWMLCQIAGAPFETEPILLLQEKQVCATRSACRCWG
jgi:hypothetical protein